MAVTRTECHFFDIIRVDSDLMVPRTQIYLGKDLSTMELVEQVINAWKWVSVLDRDLVESMIIHAQL